MNRMNKLGYAPVRRTEKPIFQEIKKGNETGYEPVARQIIFEGTLIE
ncbi:MAG: NETI motif-containing protein [Bacillus sp. (in: firmicutes)]